MLYTHRTILLSVLLYHEPAYPYYYSGGRKGRRAISQPQNSLWYEVYSDSLMYGWWDYPLCLQRH